MTPLACRSLKANVNGVICLDSEDKVVALIAEPAETTWKELAKDAQVTGGYPYQICNGGNTIPDPFIYLVGRDPARSQGPTGGSKSTEVLQRCAGKCQVWPLLGQAQSAGSTLPVAACAVPLLHVL